MCANCAHVLFSFHVNYLDKTSSSEASDGVPFDPSLSLFEMQVVDCRLSTGRDVAKGKDFNTDLGAGLDSYYDIPRH